MLPQKHRLALSPNRHFAGKFFKTPYFTFQYSVNHLSLSRIAIIISKKTLPKAVDRNHLKRQISHLLHPLINKPTPLDLVIVVHPQAAKLRYSDLSQLLHQNLKTIVNKL